jgi:peptide/nickel transport system ATP-binding protein
LACRPRLDTPYKLLPTVSDFMDVRTEGGKTIITEKELSPERLEQLKTQGRGRLLHPKNELAAMGHPWGVASAWSRFLSASHAVVERADGRVLQLSGQNPAARNGMPRRPIFAIDCP